MNFNEILTLFKTAGLKFTAHRLAVYDTLQNSLTSLTAEQIYLELKKGDSGINLSTVYRILDSFVEKQLVTPTRLMGGGKALYEINTHAHQHFLMCTGCLRKIEIATCPLNQFEQKMAHDTGFQIQSHRLELYGTCPECRAHPAK